MTKDAFLQHLESRGYHIRKADGFFEACKDPGFPMQQSFAFTVRQKAKPVWGIISKRFEYSVPRRDWCEYRKTGLPFYIFVCDLDSGKVYGSCLENLERHARLYDGDKLDEGGTMFFPQGAMKVYIQDAPIAASV
jgi:hypothetical protein